MKLLLALLLSLTLVLPCAGQEGEPEEDSRLLNVDPTYLAPYLTLGYQHTWRPDGRQLSRPNLELLVPFGPQETQALTLRTAYNFFGDVESFEDVELLYTWLFDHQDDFWQAAVLHVTFPAAGDPLAGGFWALEGEYNTRWNLDEELLWVNELHYSRNLTLNSDYLEATSELTRLISEDYLVSVGGTVRQELGLGETGLLARVGGGRRLDDLTNLNLTLLQPLNGPARGAYGDFSILLNLTRGF